MYCSGARYRAAVNEATINRTEEGDNAANLDHVFRNVVWFSLDEFANTLSSAKTKNCVTTMLRRNGGQNVWRSSTTCKIQHRVVGTSTTRLNRVPVWRRLLTTSWDNTRCLRWSTITVNQRRWRRRLQKVYKVRDCANTTSLELQSALRQSVVTHRYWINSAKEPFRALPGLNELGTGPSEVDRTVAQGSSK